MTLEPLQIPPLLKRFHLQPQKSLGQNFLADHNALLKIVKESGVDSIDEVLEIGAGLGNLTRLLAACAKQVIAIEIDKHLFPVLEVVTAPFKNIRLIQGDILVTSLSALFSENGYKVVANIPYYITSAVIRHLLESPVKPGRIVLTMQREVAERIINQNDKMSLLSLSVQVYGKAFIAGHIPAACFIPEPNVDSSILIIDVDPERKLPEDKIHKLFQLAHTAFNQKRKMLRSSLKPLLGEYSGEVSDIIEQAGVDPKARPEVLNLEAWMRLTSVIEEFRNHSQGARED
jgi:16S rRNA (adenine1518-N6/adenine1519-N6)-dimethyltransferase